MQHSVYPTTARYNFRRFTYCLAALRRRQDLRELIQWAERKRLRGPVKAYYSRFLDEEARLSRYHLTCPRTYFYARILFRIERLLTPPRTYYRGSAAKYRAANY